MRRAFLLPILALPLLLFGCSTTSVTYRLQIDIDDPEQKSELIFASMRVIDRRLANMGEEALSQDVQTMDGETSIVLTLEDPLIADLLTEQMTEPFTMRVMEEAPDDEADIIVEGHGGFKETGVTEQHLNWLTPSEDTQPGKGRVTLNFTEEGRQLMSEVFESNNGKFIGIFVRDLLVTKMMVETDVVLDDIVITDIPTVDLANVFADDMNVGLHVTFEPL